MSQPRRTSLSAVTGLLLLCLVLAAALLVTAFVTHQAMQKAALEVLHNRASQLGISFAATARFSAGLGDTTRLQELAEELSAGALALYVVDMDGQVRVGARGGLKQTTMKRHAPPILEVVQQLRLKGQYRRVVKGDDGYLELWQPLGGIRRGGPRPGRRFWNQPPPPDHGDRARLPPQARPPKGPWGQRRFGRRQPVFLRLVVPLSVTGPLVGQARRTLLFAAAACLLLVTLGVLLHRSARRARQTDDELQRRRALASLGEMAAVLAHEIRTPLASIKGHVQLLQERSPEQKQLSTVVDEAGRLERLVNGLLDYARPADPRRVTCDPDALAERAAEIVAIKAQAAGVNLMVDPGDCGLCLRADPDQLLQVLVNLLQNAVEASTQADRTEEQPPKDTDRNKIPTHEGVEAPRRQGAKRANTGRIQPMSNAAGADGSAAEGGGYFDQCPKVLLTVRKTRGAVVWTVRDHGPGLGGLDPEQLLRPFYSTRRDGTGLGLSVARQLIERHGGTLALEQPRDGGLAASATLPLTLKEEANKGSS